MTRARPRTAGPCPSVFAQVQGVCYYQDAPWSRPRTASENERIQSRTLALRSGNGQIVARKRWSSTHCNEDRSSTYSYARFRLLVEPSGPSSRTRIYKVASQPTKDCLSLKVTDFGPIVTGEVDLRPLTVFVGPSNTGKSWMAVLIYSLHQYFSAANRRNLVDLHHDQFTSPDISRQEDDLIDFSKRLQTSVYATNVPKDYLDYRVYSESKQAVYPPKSVIHLLQSAIESQGKLLSLELCRCLGFEKNRLNRQGSISDTRIVIRNVRSLGTQHIENVMTFIPQEEAIHARLIDNAEFTIDLPDNPRWLNPEIAYMLDTIGNRGSKLPKRFLNHVLASVVQLALPNLVSILRFPAFYLPAGRTGIMHARSAILSALIDRAAIGGLRSPARSPVLSGVVADFLEQLIELGHPVDERVGENMHHATRIENAILGGAIHVQRVQGSGYPTFTYQPDGWTDEIPLMNVSSMVSELAPVVLYLRYQIVSDNVIIVEEPESHLHPAMQVELTRQLAKLVQAGIRVVITTHSEWVLEELSNIVRKSALSASHRSEVANGDVLLRSDQVGAWLFESSRHSTGTIIKEIGLDTSGLFPSGFDEVAAALHNNWAEISSRMRSGK